MSSLSPSPRSSPTLASCLSWGTDALLWVGDVTMIRTGEGPLYLATVLDLFSRRLLGYAMSATTTRN
jgi:transposase InsO family protein